MELLIGCGRSREKRVARPEHTAWNDLLTLDINPDHDPDVVHDLNEIPLPFHDNTFDEIHAYEVMEHVGRQGDYEFFFKQWEDFWRILKPEGYFCGTSPAPDSIWAWGDPGHTRIVSKENFVFLSQQQYQIQIGHTPMSDYRYIYKADFDPVHTEVQNGHTIYVLRAVKPSRLGANGGGK
jgi:SAM-dependent methyltransferase